MSTSARTERIGYASATFPLGGSSMATRRWLLLPFVLGLLACEPEVGSEAWCEAMEEKPRGDWTVNEGVDYARHCIVR